MQLLHSDPIAPLSGSFFSILYLYTTAIMNYTIEKSRFGLYTSIQEDGTRMVTGMTEEAVRKVTDEIHIPVLEGRFDGYTSGGWSSTVDGKL